MPLIKKKGLYEAGRVIFLSVQSISAPPSGLRRDSGLDAVRELSVSLAKYGVLQPLCVRRSGHGYEIVSGERRLRAAKLAGLNEVPCIVLDVGEEESAAIVLVENLQRRNLDFIEEAEALGRLRELYSYSQEDIARLIGRSQPSVANKLRLLRLPTELLFAVRNAGLTERHARALLKLPAEREMACALGHMISGDMNVAQAETHVETILASLAGNQAETHAEALLPPSEAALCAVPETSSVIEPPAPVIKTRDHRFFLNSVMRGAEIMRRSGIDVFLDSVETECEIVLTIRITKKSAVG